MVNFVKNNGINTIYNEGIFRENKEKSRETIFNTVLTDTNARISLEKCEFDTNKNCLISTIKDLQGSNMSNKALLNASKTLSAKYHVPSLYIFMGLNNNGNLSLDENDKFTFSMNLNKVNVGNIRTFIWKEDGSKNISVSRSNGPDIQSLDDEEIKKIFEEVDKNNDEVKKLIEEELKKRDEDDIKLHEINEKIKHEEMLKNDFVTLKLFN
ncbi:MAG: hypothetical protein MJ232_01660 [archaeon]|nr:hypothetical protein [archaeon]